MKGPNTRLAHLRQLTYRLPTPEVIQEIGTLLGTWPESDPDGRKVAEDVAAAWFGTLCGVEVFRWQIWGIAQQMKQVVEQNKKAPRA